MYFDFQATVRFLAGTAFWGAGHIKKKRLLEATLIWGPVLIRGKTGAYLRAGAY